ncbi:MAG: FecR domain-containing protein [Phototrophicaceae bacterium]
MSKNVWHSITLSIVFVLCTVLVSAQNEFAATLEVLNSGVEVRRANTRNFINVEFEAIVGVGDVIKTDETGEARITFFVDGTDVLLESNTEYRIIEFTGDDEDFQLRVEVIIGQAVHRLNRILGINSSYDVETPGMTLAAQGTVFAIRVEDNGRSGMLVSEGIVDAISQDSTADVEEAFGVRSAVDSELSDVVRASTFDELDAALDGCTATITTPDDVSINVRLSPAMDAARVGFIAADEISTLLGISDTGNWYRIAYDGGFGWILSTSAIIDNGCAGLRVFESTQIEDTALYENLDESVSVPSQSSTTTDEEQAEESDENTGE